MVVVIINSTDSKNSTWLFACTCAFTIVLSKLQQRSIKYKFFSFSTKLRNNSIKNGKQYKRCFTTCCDVLGLIDHALELPKWFRLGQAYQLLYHLRWLAKPRFPGWRAASGRRPQWPYYFKWDYHEGLQRWRRAIYSRWFTDNSLPIRTFWSKSRVLFYAPQRVTIPVSNQRRELSIRFSRIPVQTVWFKERYQLTPGRLAQQISGGTANTWDEWISWEALYAYASFSFFYQRAKTYQDELRDVRRKFDNA